MSQNQDTIVTALMEQLIAEGPDGMAQVFTALFNLALRLERERFLGAGLYERNAERRGYANGYKSKTLDTTAGTVTVDVPKAAGADEPFYPQSLERGRRSSRAVMLAIAEMYVQGVSTRDAAKVMAEFGLKSLSSTQVSRAAALLDEELAAWRRRPLGEIHYLFLDARYEKLRDGGVVRDAALFSAIGVGADGRRRVLGVSCDPSEAEVHWRASLDSLIDRGMRGVRFVVSDDHAGLKAARRAVLPGAVWQRCQFHLAQNAIHHAPNVAIRKRIGASCGGFWNASSLQTAQEELDRLVVSDAGRALCRRATLVTGFPRHIRLPGRVAAAGHRYAARHEHRDDADGLRQQLGISRSAWIDACQTMGRYQAATAVAVIAAKRETIRSPGGYLRGMIGRAQNGELHLSNSLCATGSRGYGCTPLCDAAAHPYHRPILGGGPLDSVHRLLHPSAERRDGCRPARSHGEPPRRRAQSRPDAHGRGLHDRRPRQARLGG